MVERTIFRADVLSMEAMNALQNSAFSQLLTAWRRHDDARRSGELPHLAAARIELDRRRADMRSTLASTR